jgi:imidazolonepropionase-like amidohydrolase
MSLFAAIVILVLQAGPAAEQAPRAASAPQRLALVGGMLIDGYETPPLHHAAVLIEGNKITWVGRAADATIPSDATVIDTSGRVMMPGMIELHAHLMLLGHGNYSRWFPWVAEKNIIERVMEISAKQLLMAGVTSAVDLGGPLEASLRVRDRVKRGEIPGARLWVSGPWLPRQEGNPSPAPTSFSWSGRIDTPEDAARATETLAKAGVDVIKAYTNLTPAHYRAIVETAHKHNIRVHAHVYAEQDVRNALEAGVDVLQHVGSAGTTPPYSKGLIRDIVNAGRPVVVSAAHRSWIYPATTGFPERLQEPQLKQDFAVIAGLWDEVQDSFKLWHSLSYFQRTDREMFFRERALGQFIEAGAVMGMGTDSGTPMNFHAEALWREIKAHVDTGMSPQRAISAATRIGARILGRGNDLGTIQPGKLADIIVLKRNPLFDIQALSDVEVVVKDGVVHKGGPGGPARQTSSKN